MEMNDGQIWGWIGGVGGSLIGVVGGIIGTYFSIRNTNGPRERAFVVKCVVYCWAAIAIFLGLLLFLPNPYRGFIWAPYAILLSLGIRHANTRQQQIRKEESANKAVNPGGGSAGF
jgi:hypothetical protein